MSVVTDFEWTGQRIWHDFPNRLKVNPFAKDTEFFTVVRNPYDRFINYYYYFHKGKNMEFLNNKENLNEFAKVQNALRWKKGTLYAQHHYVYNDDGTQLIDHVLHLETLNTDGKFEELMKKFNLSVILPQVSLNQRSIGNKLLTIEDLSKEAIGYINGRFEKDFALFGYDIIKGN